MAMAIEELRAALPPTAILVRAWPKKGQAPGRGPECQILAALTTGSAQDRGPGAAAACGTVPARNLALANDLRLLKGRRHATLPACQGAMGPSRGRPACGSSEARASRKSARAVLGLTGERIGANGRM